MSLKTRFILFFGMGSVFFLLVISTLIFSRMEAAMEKQLKQQFQTDIHTRISIIKNFFSTHTENFNAATKVPMFRSMRFHELTLNQTALKNDFRQMELYFFEWLKQNPEITQIQYINNKGSEVFRVNQSEIAQNLSDMSQNLQIKQLLKLDNNQYKITRQEFYDKKQNLVWWMPVYISASNAYGVIGFSVSYTFILDKVKNLVISKDETACLLGEDNNILVNTSNTDQCKSNNDWSITENIHLPGINWSIIMSVNPNSFLHEVKEIRFVVFAIIFPIIAVIAFIFTFVFSSHILGAISKLVKAAHIMGTGDTLSPIQLNRNDELGVLAIEMNRAAKQIEKGRDELEEKNRDLEAYSYTLAHDLRAPLRSITSFSQILEMDAVDKLEEDELDALHRIIAASKRMSALIDDILELARISNRDIEMQNISLSLLAESIIAQFKENDPQRDVHIEIRPNMKTNGDPQLLRLILENLLGNAWKFTKDKESAEIKFDFINNKDGVIFFVRDNGIGFDMKYEDKLFKPFQRLHKSEDFQGTGIGLASVKRMIERHNGRIWIHSIADHGTSLFFTLWHYPDKSVTDSIKHLK